MEALFSRQLCVHYTRKGSFGVANLIWHEVLKNSDLIVFELRVVALLRVLNVVCKFILEYSCFSSKKKMHLERQTMGLDWFRK